MSATFHVNAYTATWDAAVTQRHHPAPGDAVIMPENPDAREYDAFRRRLSGAGLSMEWAHPSDEEPGMGVYTIVVRGRGDGDEE